MGATCTVQTIEILVNSSLKATIKKNKKMAMVISEIQVSNPGPSWPSCFCIKTKKHPDIRRDEKISLVDGCIVRCKKNVGVPSK